MIEIILTICFLGLAYYLFCRPLTEEEKKIDIKKEYEDNGN